MYKDFIFARCSEKLSSQFNSEMPLEKVEKQENFIAAWEGNGFRTGKKWKHRATETNN